MTAGRPTAGRTPTGRTAGTRGTTSPVELSLDHPLRSLFRLVGKQRRRLIVLMIAYVIKDSPQWVLPVITGAIIDVVARRGELHSLWLYALGGVLVLAQNYPVGIFYNDRWSRLYRQVGADLRNALVERLQNLSIGFHTRASAAVIQTKVVRDVENIEQMLQGSFPPSMSALCILVGALTMTAIQVPAFILVFLVTIPIGVGLVYGVRKVSDRRNQAFRLRMETFSKRVGEMATLMPVTRAHGLEGVAARRVVDSVEDVRDAAHTLDQLNGRFGAVSWLMFQFLAVFCLVAAAAASLSGIVPITPGQVVLLSSYFTILTNAIVMLLNLAPVLARGRESVRSIAEVLEEPDLEFNHRKSLLYRVDGRITIDDVSFSYPGDPSSAIDHVSLEVARGETVAFVGPSGSGKSTLLNLVLGFVRPTSGRIMLDDRDMAELDLRQVRGFFSVVPQDSVLFEGSIRDNVAYGLPGVTDQQLENALRDANALELVQSLPNGWDTVVGERGARLSGGQRQRLAIARALIRNPRVLMLDEATSALDSNAENAVQEALERLRRGRTTLVVAHRLSTIRSADRIVVLDHGRIAEIGNHEALLSAGGLYAGLVRAQRL
ncbi:ABC transporter ATP-binding protein [Naasia lichenicola]|uniref:ABC transporter ATP-binding protein n=1 Tax=Naasia lichenicola TaxID=2565933 RepID=A0A4S4FGA1_9MICO|nr:ABC transporter ATP-binding protein [Naasia lichenicola]THG29270.1 ABC transporter ATP-binding protein [Naasia lichenicola]